MSVGREHFFDAEAVHSVAELGGVDVIAVAEQVPRRRVEGEGLHDLLGSPLAAGVCGHVEMHHSASVMGEDQKDEQDLETDGRDSEEIDGYQVLDVIIQERPPAR